MLSDRGGLVSRSVSSICVTFQEMCSIGQKFDLVCVYVGGWLKISPSYLLLEPGIASLQNNCCECIKHLAIFSRYGAVLIHRKILIGGKRKISAACICSRKKYDHAWSVFCSWEAHPVSRTPISQAKRLTVRWLPEPNEVTIDRMPNPASPYIISGELDAGNCNWFYDQHALNFLQFWHNVASQISTFWELALFCSAHSEPIVVCKNVNNRTITPIQFNVAVHSFVLAALQYHFEKC